MADVVAGGRARRRRALVFNLFVLPRVGGGALSSGRSRARRRTASCYYPLAVLLLLLVFPRRLDIVAAAWGILAAGDGIATLGGPRDRRPALAVEPRQDRQRQRGLRRVRRRGRRGARLVVPARGRAAAGARVRARCAPIAAAVVAALVETIPVRLDDNISVPATAGAVLWIASLVIDATRRADAAARSPAVARCRRARSRVNAAGRVGRLSRAHGLDVRRGRRRASSASTIFVGARLAGLGAAARRRSSPRRSRRGSG